MRLTRVNDLRGGFEVICFLAFFFFWEFLCLAAFLGTEIALLD